MMVGQPLIVVSAYCARMTRLVLVAARVWLEDWRHALMLANVGLGVAVGPVALSAAHSVWSFTAILLGCVAYGFGLGCCLRELADLERLVSHAA